jgi:hypothetical protein
MAPHSRAPVPWPMTSGVPSPGARSIGDGREHEASGPAEAESAVGEGEPWACEPNEVRVTRRLVASNHDRYTG